MFEKEIEVELREVIIVGKEKKMLYVSNNGKEFKNKDDALKEDEKDNRQKAKQELIKELESKLKYIVINEDKLFYISDEKIIVEYVRLINIGSYSLVKGNLGQWFYLNFVDGISFSDRYEFIPVSELIKRVEDIQKKLREIAVQ